MKKIFLLLGLLTSLTAFSQRRYNVIAYYTGNAETLKQYPLDKITHIIYSFLKVQNDSLTFRDDLQRQNVMQMVELKKEHPQLKIMVSIGGWGGCSFCSGLFDTASRRNTFVQTAAALLKQYNIDGLDLDWEYPVIEGYPGHPYSPRDKDNFTAMVKELRAAIGHDYLLTFAAGGFTYYLNESIDWAAVTPYVDYINLMTYDLVGGYSKVTGHHTATADYMPDQQSVTKCVNALLDKKVPASKLIVGAAFYGRVWQNVPDTNHGLYQPGDFLQGVSYKNFDTYFTDSLGYTYYWDKKARAPYQYSTTKKLFATFDDPASINEKAKLVRRKKLGGIMFWQLLDDKFSDGLTEAVWKDLNE
ncbi:MAG: glycoside hydrolase family 18 protein [Bacteroidetes bacterium]|nr:glycoside hydrolase family 18 protein [Bacteroidota bacterium]